MIELGFNIEPDRNGIFDGRELAGLMVQTAYALLAPYVNACPACTDELFSVVANGAIGELLRDGPLSGKIMKIEADADGARWRRHIAETGGVTRLLLGISSDRAYTH